MTTQPEALRLADALDGWDDGYSATPRLAAAELRRLHAELAAPKAGKCWTYYGTKQDANCSVPIFLGNSFPSKDRK